MKKIVFIVVATGWLMTILANNVVPHDGHRYCVILAGGSGERLWPLSRARIPKQLLQVGGESSLLAQAIERVTSIVPSSHIWVSTTRQHAPTIQQEVGATVGAVVAEPGSRNTGPAILYCCLELYKHDPDAIVSFLPADPYIPANAPFAEFLEHAFDYAAEHNRITLLGLKPRYAATGYGYIEYNPHEYTAGNGVMPVKAFYEKPSYEKAQEYVASGCMLWNAGMFCAPVRAFLQEFERCSPSLWHAMQQYQQGNGAYQDIESISVDYAVMEKSANISVLPVDFSWCDVGNLEIFLSLKDKNEMTQSSQQVVTIDAHNNLVDAPGKLVALVGVDDLCVVDTGDTLLIVKRHDAEKVKMVVKALKDKQAHDYL